MRYYISRAGQQFGPYSLADLQQYVAQGNVLLTDLACGEGQTQWVPVSQVVGGGSGAAPQPAAPQPAQSYGQPAYAAQPAYAGPQASLPGAIPMDYATWGTRVLGYIIDSVLVGAAVGLLWLVLGSMLAALAAGMHSDAFGGGVCCLMLILFPLGTLLVGLYNRVYLVSLRGYSIGQGVVKVKVVLANGSLLPRNTALVRLLAQLGLNLIPLVGLLDLLWPLWDPTRQTLHDKAVGSYVINNPSGR